MSCVRIALRALTEQYNSSISRAIVTRVRGRIASFKITRPRIALVVMSEAKQSGTDSANPRG